VNLRFFDRSMGRDLRVWPMLVALLLVVLAAVGCVLWFMRAAMENERLAVREKLAEAYSGQLTLVQAQILERWNFSLAKLDKEGPAEARFLDCYLEGFAQSVICRDAAGKIAYPGPARAPASEPSRLQSELRELVQSGDNDSAVQFVLKQFALADATVDEHGRMVAANAELLALELLAGKSDPREKQIFERLCTRLNRYSSDTFPAAQRRFLMHEVARLHPDAVFPTLAAEDLAARFLESDPDLAHQASLRATELRDVWMMDSPKGSALALFATDGVRARLNGLARYNHWPKGVSIVAGAPGEEASGDLSALITLPLGTELPGWKVSLFLDDRTLFDSEAARRVKYHVLTAAFAIAGMLLLSLFIAGSFRRQVKLARLKNDLVSTVSHELKTPLTSMRALVDTLLDKKELDEKTTREYLQLLSGENTRLSRLIENFLAFSRLERNQSSLVFEPVTPQEIVDGAVAAFGERGKAPGCSLDTRVAPGLRAFSGDRGALTTVLLNLLDNAWKYSGEEKKIVISAGGYEGGIRFAVADNGMGLSAAEQRRVFDPFYQADQRLARSVGGCGLGLSIVRSIVEGLHGTVRVVSEPGQGSTFMIEIPTGKEIPS